MDWQAAVERTVTGMGYDPIDIERSGAGLLRVLIDRVAGRAYETGPGEFITVDDCEFVTRQLLHVLEVEGASYERLEVSSPGLDRPLKKPADWQRFEGCDVDVTLRAPFEKRRKWRGRLAARSDGGWRLVLPAAKGQEEQSLDFALEEVREARLVPVVDFKGRRRDVARIDDGGQLG